MLKEYGYYIISGILIPAFGILIYKLRSKVTVNEAQELSNLRTKDAPLEFLKQSLEKRDAEISASRIQLHTFINNHLEHDSQERLALGKVLTETTLTLQAIATDIKAHREEESRRAAEVFNKLEVMHVKIAGIH